MKVLYFIEFIILGYMFCQVLYYKMRWDILTSLFLRKMGNLIIHTKRRLEHKILLFSLDV